jgi:hypothetical protein
MDEHYSLDTDLGSGYHFESERYQRVLIWLPRNLSLNLHCQCKQALALMVKPDSLPVSGDRTMIKGSVPHLS